MALLQERRAFLRYTVGTVASAVSSPLLAMEESEPAVTHINQIHPASMEVATRTSTVTEHIVEITDFAFVPAKLVVNAGDTITWVNRDIAPHTATAADNSWNTGFIGHNKQKSLLIQHDMVMEYYCQYHPMMKARLEIKCSR